MADDRVRGLQDVAGGAVVLLEPVDRHGREVALEAQDVLDARAAPAVDALVVVAHRHELAGVACQQLQPRVLHRVRVLELVDQDVLEARAIVREHVVTLEPQFVAAQQQLGEVHHAGLPAGRLVAFVDIAECLLDRATGLHVPGPQPFVLGAIDVPGGLPRRIALLVEVHRLDHALHQAQLVVGIEDLERLWQARFRVVDAQQAVRDAMEGAHPQHVHRHAHLLLDARTHLPRGLVREGHGEDGVGRHARLEQVCDAVHEHARLAAARTCEHERVARRGNDGLLLCRVEAGGRVRGIHADSVPATHAQVAAPRARRPRAPHTAPRATRR